MSDRLARLLAARPYLVADGAMGTNLFARGLMSGDAPEPWNVDHPDRVAAVHQGFVDAGSDIILTNTFGANRQRLKLHKMEHRVIELNAAGARLARAVADASGRDIVVGGSIGPTGDLLQPLGALTMDAARAVFAEQASGLKQGGADVLWIETMSAKEEMEAAVAGASSVDMPIVACMTFDTNGRTMMGLTPGDAVRFLSIQHPKPTAYGANCGTGPAELIASILGLVKARIDGQDVIVAKGNCGIPQYRDGKLEFTGTPALMAEYAKLARDAGARIIGACCGSEPAHLKAIADALRAHAPGLPPDIATVEARLGALNEGAKQSVDDATATPREPRKRRRG